MEPTLGFEPRTCCLRNSCSTAELCRRRSRIADAQGHQLYALTRTRTTLCSKHSHNARIADDCAIAIIGEVASHLSFRTVVLATVCRQKPSRPAQLATGHLGLAGVEARISIPNPLDAAKSAREHTGWPARVNRRWRQSRHARCPLPCPSSGPIRKLATCRLATALAWSRIPCTRWPCSSPRRRRVAG